jgi:multicomponent Na+:H+ antiporter subunit B
VTRRLRLLVFALGAVGVLAVFLPATRHLPAFGADRHPYRDLAVATSVQQETANAVSSVNFDQRAFDTLGEETILLASVVGVVALLRSVRGDVERQGWPGGGVLEPTLLLGYLLLPVTTLLGLDVLAHGHLTPGGGFQGGVVLATALHLLYVTGSFSALERLRPLAAFELGDAAGAAAFVGLGFAGLFAGSAFLANTLPHGTFGALLSAGTVPLLSTAVGIEVAAGTVLLLASFLRQAITLEDTPEHPPQEEQR